MKAVIMCGGLGSRLRPLTENVPKPLIRLMNVPVLKQIIDRLIQNGIKEIYLSLGYMASEITAYCESQSFNAELHYITETKPLGTAGGVRNCLDCSDETVLVLSGDNVFGFNLREIEKYHIASGASFTVVGKLCDDPREYGTILVDEECNIKGFTEKPTWETAESFLINTGTYIIDGKILEMIPKGTAYDFSLDLFPRILSSDFVFKCYKTDEMWGDIGEIESYLALTEGLLKKSPAGQTFSGKFYAQDSTDENGNTIIAPCLIENSFLMGKNNTIGPFAVIGKDVVIGTGCAVRNCIIGNGCRISDSTDITDSVLDDASFVADNCCVEKFSVLGFGVKIGRFARVSGGAKISPGISVPQESTVCRDLKFESPEKIDLDIFGISGKLFSQITLSDSIRIGQAIASVPEIKRIGVGTDGKASSSLYSSVLLDGARSCGAICYDFDRMFKTQAYFYSAYCSLDSFIYVSTDSNVISYGFFGKNGYPFSAKTARKINNNFRFSSFMFSEAESITECFKMNLLSTVYGAMLNKSLVKGEHGISISCECENATLKQTFDTFIKRNSSLSLNAKTKIVFLFNDTGTEMYCLENDKFYSFDKIQAAVAETVFSEGKDILVKEDAPDCIFKKAREYGREVKEIVENSSTEAYATEGELIDNLWSFDALFLAIKLVGILSVTGLTLEELCSLQNDFTVRKSVVKADCSPSKIRTKILNTGAVKTGGTDAYYRIANKRGTVKLRQLGNSDRIRVLVEAADMETAKELSADIRSKFEARYIDNIKK